MLGIDHRVYMEVGECGWAEVSSNIHNSTIPDCCSCVFRVEVPYYFFLFSDLLAYASDMPLNALHTYTSAALHACFGFPFFFRTYSTLSSAPDMCGVVYP